MPAPAIPYTLRPKCELTNDTWNAIIAWGYLPHPDTGEPIINAKTGKPFSYLEVLAMLCREHTDGRKRHKEAT